MVVDPVPLFSCDAGLRSDEVVLLLSQLLDAGANEGRVDAGLDRLELAIDATLCLGEFAFEPLIFSLLGVFQLLGECRVLVAEVFDPIGPEERILS